MKKNMKRMLSIVISVIFLAGILAGFTMNQQKAKSEPKELSYSIFLWDGQPFTPPKKDIVADAISSKWKINVTDWFYEAGQNWADKLNLFVASNTVPDLFEIPAANVDSVAKYAEQFVDLTPYLADPAKTPNIHKYLNKKIIDSMKTFEGGKNLYWPTQINPDFSDPAQKSKYANDYIERKSSGLVIMAREDVLTKAGYKFKPRAQLEKELKTSNKRLTYNDIKLTPEIKTVADFESLLTKIKKLNLKAPNGKAIIPFGGQDPTFALGASYAFTFARFINNKAVSFYGGPYAKDLFKTMNKWYRNGLMSDTTFIYSKQQDKFTDMVATGQMATWNGGWIPNEETAEANLIKSNPKAAVRYITYPKFRADVPQYQDGLQPGATRGLLINKNYKDVDKLISYLDWLYSDEAQEIMMWGGQEGGLWEIKDGKKVFKNPELYKAVVNGTKTANGEDATYYGIFDSTKQGYASTYTRGVNSNTLNKFKYQNSYPQQYQIRNEMVRIAGEPASSVDGTASSVFKGNEAQKVNNFFWSQSWDLHARMVLAKTDAEFNKQYNTVYKSFTQFANYPKAMQDMAKSFRVLMGK